MFELSQEKGILAFRFGDAAIAFVAIDADRGDHAAKCRPPPISCANFQESSEGDATQVQSEGYRSHANSRPRFPISTSHSSGVVAGTPPAR
jgi:hypothetical protein